MRFPHKTKHHGQEPLTLRSDHEALGQHGGEAHTIFRSTVRQPDGKERLLKSGHNNAKIGRMVEKGAWQGMPIYSLTLEERATCPRTCREWRTCYGNRMPFAHRFASGKGLEAQLDTEIRELAVEHCHTGFVVRLHILGDFYSTDYVELWREFLRRHRGLHIFGYTAHKLITNPIEPIAYALRLLSADYPRRFIIRESGYEAITVPGTLLAPPGSIVCPAQTAQSLCCGTCTLCWSAKDKVIAFVGH